MELDTPSSGNRTRSPRHTRPTKTCRNHPRLPSRRLWRKRSSAAIIGRESTSPRRSQSERLFCIPTEQRSLSENVSWLAQPATEKQKEYIRILYAPKGLEGSYQATELVIEGRQISTDDLSKGQAGDLM